MFCSVFGFELSRGSKKATTLTKLTKPINAANEVQDEVNFGPYFGSNVAVCQLRTSMEVP